jgi:hypothetical protein
MVDLDYSNLGGGVVILLVMVTLPLVLKALLGSKTGYRYPAGPKGSPLFGNLFQVPPKYAGRKFAEWGNEYGEMCASSHLLSQANHDVLIHSTGLRYN